MILYIIIAIILFVILCMGYIRIKYPFWAVQPVFHYYDVHYWFKDVGVIEPELPSKNKFYNPKITTYLIQDVPKYKMNEIIRLIQTNYILNKENKHNKFIPTAETLLPYFNSHNDPCYCSIINDSLLLQELKTNRVIDIDKIIGVITSRPLHVDMIKQNIQFDVYYIDYLCVDKSHRKQGIAPQLIQTHEYNQRHKTHHIKVSLFKREDELTGIMPICAYDTYGFSSETWNVMGHMPILKADKQNIHPLYDFIQTNRHLFELTIFPEISNLLELISTGNIMIYMRMNLEMAAIQCAYFFRKSCTFITDTTEVLSCFASINSSASQTDFINGFKTVVCTIKTEFPAYNYVSIEKISHSEEIINDLIQKTTPQISKTAYFFYNFAYHSFDSKKVLIVN